MRLAPLLVVASVSAPLLLVPLLRADGPAKAAPAASAKATMGAKATASASATSSTAASASAGPSSSTSADAATSSSAGLGALGSDDTGAAAATTPPPAPTPVVVTGVDKPPPPRDPKHASWHPFYGAELEGHFAVAGLDRFGPGLGFGARVGIPIAQNTPISSIDDDITLGLGLDWVRYAAYKPVDGRTSLTVQAFYVPVYLQWNFWVGSRVSIFLEPALVYRFATYSAGCPVPTGFSCEDTTRVLPTGSVGIRFRTVDKVALTIRVGWPMVTIGASWL